MPEITSSRYLVQAGWDHVPHLDDKTKAELLATTPPHLRDARSKGIPSLGSGAIYPVPLSEIEVKPFRIPDYWPRGYGLDVGWNCTAAIWGARDPSTSVLYLYAEHYRGQAEPPIHAQAIKARGDWIRGAIDPASRGRSQNDGQQLMANYLDLGLKVVAANNEVEAALDEIWMLLSTGMIKVFSTLPKFKEEYGMYQRDEKGRVVKKFDHLMDAFRYLVRTWDRIAKVPDARDRGIVAGRGVGDRIAGY